MSASFRSCVLDSKPVGNRDAQHRRIALDVEAVAQPQRAELVLGELAVEEAPRLVAELRDALVHQALVDFVVEVHGAGCYWGVLILSKTNVLECYDL